MAVIPLQRVVKRGTLASILRQVGLTADEFLELPDCASRVQRRDPVPSAWIGSRRIGSGACKGCGDASLECVV